MKKKVLLVENDSSTREVLEVMLDMLHIPFKSVAGVEQAKAELRKECPDLILLDFLLDDGTGKDVMYFAQAMYDSRVKVAIMTAMVGSDTINEELRPFALIKKPFEFETIEQIVTS